VLRNRRKLASFKDKVQAAKTAAKAPAQVTKPKAETPKKTATKAEASKTATTAPKVAGEQATKVEKTPAQTANEAAKAIAENKPKVQNKKPVAKSPFVAQPAAPRATGVTIADEGTVLEGAPAGMGPTSAGKEVMVMDQNQLNQRLAGESSVRGTEANTADLGSQAPAAPQVQQRTATQMPGNPIPPRPQTQDDYMRQRAIMGGIGGMRPEMGRGAKGGQRPDMSMAQTQGRPHLGDIQSYLQQAQQRQQPQQGGKGGQMSQPQQPPQGGKGGQMSQYQQPPQGGQGGKGGQYQRGFGGTPQTPPSSAQDMGNVLNGMGSKGGSR
jgi:hypothetical protein